MTLKIGLYPGTFDPITLGHIDVIKRSFSVCEKLIIAVAKDTPKNTLFSLEDRVKLIKNDIKNFLPDLFNKVEVIGFKGLLVDFAEQKKASIIIRGLRAVSDFEYEFQLASMNSRIKPSVQTVFIPASETKQFIASNLVKEVARLKGDVSQFVSKNTEKNLKAIFKSHRI
ncbi:MAG: pantetheine-phosphate adenylyltransferase [Rickettsiales bacterium]|nr:pantetheine-phosphate adenylyltransferase [Rickettsiales bacterium]